MIRSRGLLAILLCGGLAAAAPSQDPQGQPALPRGAEPKAAPAVGLKLGQRTAAADARRTGLAYNSAPLVDVTQPQPNVLVITLTGVAVAGGVPCEGSAAEIVFDLLQSVEVTGRPNQPVRLSLDCQLAGMFRGSRDGAGVATTGDAEAAVGCRGTPVLQAAIPGRTHGGKDTVLVTDRTPVQEALVVPGEYCLSQKFSIRCSHPKKCFHKNVMTAAFGTIGGRAPEWLGLLDPTWEIPRQRDLGFRVILRADPAQ